jgi:isochorismate pyruvate lyase
MIRKIVLVGILICPLGAASAEDAAATHPAYWGSPSVDGGKCCSNLREVRDNIDRIDRQIIQLMAEREKYVAEAGRFKSDPAAVSAPARVEAIIAKVRQIASGEGLAETVAERTFRAMIAAFEDYEREEWTRRNAGGGTAPAK